MSHLDNMGVILAVLLLLAGMILVFHALFLLLS
jgi:hypothetical protein